jgi:hypothetical protein
LSEVQHKTIEPLRRGLGNVIRELLGEKATEQQVLLCQMSIRSQCFDKLFRERLRKTLIREEAEAAMLAENISVDAIVEHITQFSLAGIREVRRQIESGELSEKRADIITVPASESRTAGRKELTSSRAEEKSTD